MTAPNYVVVGDSQAEGVLLGGALPALLGERLTGRYDHRGWSSARLLSDGAIGSAAGRAAATGAKILIFSGGNDNDVSVSSDALTRYQNTLLAIVKAIAHKSALAGVRLDVVWFGPVHARTAFDSRQHPATATAMGTLLRSSRVREAIDEVPGAQVTVRFVDSQNITRDLSRESNVHLTATAYRTYAERALGAADGGGAAGTGLLLLLGGAAAYWWWKKR